MSLGRALRALRNLGLAEMDAQVYIYLSKRGPHGLNDLADALKVHNNRLAVSLDNLRARNMIESAPEPSDKYYAIPLEHVLDEFLKAAKEEANALQASKDELLKVWRTSNRDGSSNS